MRASAPSIRWTAGDDEPPPGGAWGAPWMISIIFGPNFSPDKD